MTTFHEADQQWHVGEEQMHKLLRVPERDNPTSPFLSPYASQLLIRSPLVAAGALDVAGRPWTSIWGGETGFSQPIGQSIIGVRATVDRKYDPVIGILLGDKGDGDVVREDGPGRMISGLGIDLESRNRVKLYGRMVAGSLAATEGDAGEAQLVVRIEQSLGNCPKYLNKKHIVPAIPAPKIVSDSLPLVSDAVDLLAKADLFFISSSNHMSDMDTNNRGGPKGFVRLESNEEGNCSLIYPEYSGNRLYQTLGNLLTTPKAGLAIPDFDTGDVLYVTGTTEVLVGEKAARVIPHTNLAVRIRVEAARFVQKGLSFRGISGEPSPYNPPVRHLAQEGGHEVLDNSKQIAATLVEKEILSPTIARFRFHITDPEKSSRWNPGQYVTLSFADELDIGYSHMRDDDPKSLNDDYLRTFTVSSGPGDISKYDEFEITIRKVGRVTEHLFRTNVRSRLEIPLKGFGGEFIFQQSEGEQIGCVAGGIGITPLLAQASVLDLSRLHLYWTVRAVDLGLVLDTFDRAPGLVHSTELFVTGHVNGAAKTHLQKLDEMKASVELRRMGLDDLKLQSERGKSIEKWYVCTGDILQKQLLEWLNGRVVMYESFNY